MPAERKRAGFGTKFLAGFGTKLLTDVLPKQIKGATFAIAFETGGVKAAIVLPVR